LRTNLALANILSNLPKTALSLAGIGVAIVLIFMQLGFRGAVGKTAVNIYDVLDFDILIRSPDYLHFVDSNRLALDGLNEIAGLSAVDSVNSLKVAIATWRNQKGEYKGVLLLAVDPTRSPLLLDSINAQLGRLDALDVMLVDDKSHREFSPLNGRRFTDQDIGRTIQVADRPTRIVGIFSLGAGLAANGSAIVSQATFDQLVPYFGRQNMTFGLIKIRLGQSPTDVAAAIARRFQVLASDAQGDESRSSIEILTRDQVLARELNRWMNETPIGFIFTLGVLIALLVGAAIVYMVLGNDVADRLNEYATLRAMGYSNFYLATVVMKQAAYLAVFSFVPALAVSQVLYRLTSALANLGLEMNLPRIALVAGLTFMMCCASGTLAMRKLWQAAPADLY
jgi:putative ABC transport system permease protein